MQTHNYVRPDIDPQDTVMIPSSYRNRYFEQQSGISEEPQIWPMSSGQLRVWFVEQLAGEIAANNLSFGLRLTGELDAAALELSLRLVVDRHEALRTTFDIVDGVPMQFIHRTRPPVQAIDLSGFSAQELEEEAYALAQREIHRPFDLSKGPLVRLLVLQLRPDSHVLLGILHHIICDNWSLGLFVGELERCYRAFCRGTDPGLKPVPVQYADYVTWQREWLASKEFERQLAYLADKLAGAPPLLDLSADGVRPDRQSFAGSTQTCRLSKDLVHQIQAVATRHNATPFAVLLTALHILLSLYSGETDILVGVPVAGRSTVELEEAIGNFANLVVIWTDFSADQPFFSLLRAVRDKVLDALAHQEVPFERVVAALHPSRNLGENPIFQVLFTSVKAAAPWNSFGELQASPYVVETGGAAFDLSISLIEDSPEVWWLRAEYRTDLLTADRITDLLDHYIQLLGAVVAHPEARLVQLDRPVNWPVARRGTQGERKAAGAMPGRTEKRASAYLRATNEAQSGDQIEDILTRIWFKVLGTRPPDVTSNFFDLGGHSLMAVRLISEIGRALGTKVPVSFIFQEPTIESMARRLRGGSQPTAAVSVHQGGSRPLFFCSAARPVHREFARARNPEQPFFELDVFSLQEQRELAGRPLHRSVPDIAASFRRDILAIQPTGPYFLGGMCAGGIIAFEVALQLQEQGYQVALLAEFDTPVSGTFRRNPIQQLQYWHWRFSSGWLPRPHYKLLRFIKRWFPSSPEEERLFRIWRVIWKAVWKYRPKRVFDGEIQLFRARNPATWFVKDVATGWNARGSHGVKVHELADEHVAFFRDLPSQRVINNVIEQTYRNAVSR